MTRPDPNDDLADLLGLPPATTTVDLTPPTNEQGEERPLVHLPAASPFTITCTDCRGTGQFYSYSGRHVGQCFRCKGVGKVSPRQVGARKARVTRENNKIAKLEAFKTEKAELYAWLQREAPRFEFAASLLGSLEQYGSLTENQEAAAVRCLERSRERQAQWARERAERAAREPAPVVQRTIDPNSDIPF